MNKKEKSDEIYRLTVTRTQLDLIYETMEEYFRLRMGLEFDFCDDLAAINHDLSENNREHQRIFDKYIDRRNHMSEVMKCLFRIAFGPFGCPEEKTDKMLIAEDIWDVIRFETGRSRWNSHLHEGPEPSMLIEKIGAEKE